RPGTTLGSLYMEGGRATGRRSSVWGNKVDRRLARHAQQCGVVRIEVGIVHYAQVTRGRNGPVAIGTELGGNQFGGCRAHLSGLPIAAGRNTADHFRFEPDARYPPRTMPGLVAHADLSLFLPTHL